MDDAARREVDATCLRLLGFEQCKSLPNLWFGPWCDISVEKEGPTRDAEFVVPLAEALRARGYAIQMTCFLRWHVEIRDDVDGPKWDFTADELPEALAVAAARAVAEGDGQSNG
jgi:hypothetical protein